MEFTESFPHVCLQNRLTENFLRVRFDDIKQLVDVGQLSRLRRRLPAA